MLLGVLVEDKDVDGWIHDVFEGKNHVFVVCLYCSVAIELIEFPDL
jgi:hypothetical protein